VEHETHRIVKLSLAAYLERWRHVVHTEWTTENGRRIDIASLDRRGLAWGWEVKSIADRDWRYEAYAKYGTAFDFLTIVLPVATHGATLPAEPAIGFPPRDLGVNVLAWDGEQIVWRALNPTRIDRAARAPTERARLCRAPFMDRSAPH
jgi:hypothetical protein